MATRAGEGRQRTRSMLSFGSRRSRNSAEGVPKMDLTETSKEKSHRRMTSKADPTKAMNEAQPATTALDKSTMGSIRNIQHRDAQGNIIADPDRSNPTRPRLERPLDTIRSFEAAIDGSHNRRTSFVRPASLNDNHTQSRRNSSYVSGFSSNGLNSHQQRFPADNYGGGGGSYGNRMSFSRPDSYIDNYANPPNQHQSNQGRSARLSQRMNPEAGVYGRSNQAVYPSHAHQQSYDTVTSVSGTGSHGTDQWGTSTDPSSENSSIDKIQQVPKADLGEEYGFSGFGGAPQIRGPILEEHGLDAPMYGQPGYGHPQMSLSNGYPYQGNSGGPPPLPQKESASRAPIKLGNSSASNGELSYVQPQPLEKRKSWLKRRFSKS